MVHEQLSRAHILDGQRILPKAGVVGNVGQQIPIVTDRESAEGHELLAFGQFVHIQHDLFRSIHTSLFAAVNRVLLASLGARIIKVIAVAIRHLDIRLLDAPQHFGVQLFLQPVRGLHHRVGIGVLRFEVGFHLRIAFLTQPEIVVNHGHTVDHGGSRDFLGHRWRR